MRQGFAVDVIDHREAYPPRRRPAPGAPPDDVFDVFRRVDIAVEVLHYRTGTSPETVQIAREKLDAGQ